MSETNVNTVEAQDLQQFTEQQIEDFCDMLEVGSEVIPGATAVIALQIIRQLQGVTKRHG